MISMVTFSIEENAGISVAKQMAEGQVRAIMAKMGVVPPPVICIKHAEVGGDA